MASLYAMVGKGTYTWPVATVGACAWSLASEQFRDGLARAGGIGDTVLLSDLCLTLGRHSTFVCHVRWYARRLSAKVIYRWCEARGRTLGHAETCIAGCTDAVNICNEMFTSFSGMQTEYGLLGAGCRRGEHAHGGDGGAGAIRGGHARVSIVLWRALCAFGA